MTGREMRLTMQRLGMANETLATRLGINPSSVQRWLSGVYTVPEHVAQWMRELSDLDRSGDAAAYDQLLNALPRGWQESGINERDKQRHTTKRTGAVAG